MKNEKNIVIGVEGEVASGKTSACRELAKKIENCIFVDAGAICRGIIVAIQNAGFDVTKVDTSKLDILQVMKKLNVGFKIENNETAVYINDKKIENKDIQTEFNSFEVSKIVSETNNEKLFDFAKSVIDLYKNKYNIVLSARDLVEMYPDMDYHIYITCDIEERVNRRLREFKNKYSYDEIKNMILKRDEIHKKAGFNKKCDRTIVVDITECKTPEESAEKILQKMENF